jgi:hypothetical protein
VTLLFGTDALSMTLFLVVFDTVIIWSHNPTNILLIQLKLISEKDLKP